MIRPLVPRGVELGTLADWFERQAFQLIRRESFTSPAKNIMIFPKILDPSVAVISDHLTYKRKECTVYVGVNIDYRVWLNSAPKVRLDILAENVKLSLAKITSKHLSEEDRAKLVDIMDRVMPLVRAKLVN
jgi:hypothetical protein